jgi:hypothetical protein
MHLPPMLRTCEADGCHTLTFGPLCLAHEPPAAPRRFPRGRPYRLIEREVTVEMRRIEQSWSYARQAFSRSPSVS